MQFQAAQVLEVAKITKDTLRHWKKFLMPISDMDGRSRQYTLAELVGICVIARAVQGLGVPVSQFSAHAVSLFRRLDQHLADGGAPPLVLCIVPSSMFFTEDASFPIADVVAFVRIAPVIESVFEAIKPSEARTKPTKAEREQLILPF